MTPTATRPGSSRSRPWPPTSPTAVSVDASGNIYIGGSVSGGVIGAGQTAQGGGDAYPRQVRFQGQAAGGKPVRHQRQPTAWRPPPPAPTAASMSPAPRTATPSWPNMPAATSPPRRPGPRTWAICAAGGSIGGLTVSGGKVYVSGATSNANLTAGGSASIAAPASGGIDAFVFSATDNGASVSANTVTYIGTAGTDTAGDVTVASDGTIYVAGSTTGTFAGAQRSVQNVNNAFATALNSDGTVQMDPAVWRRRRRLDRRGPGHRYPRLQRAGRAGPAARHHLAEPVGGPDQPDHLAGRRHLPDRDPGHRGAHRHHHHRPGRDLRFAGDQDQRPAGRHRQGQRELHRRRRESEDHGQCRQHHQPDGRARRISMPWRGWALPPAC